MLAMFSLFLRGLQIEARRSLRKIAEDEANQGTPDLMHEAELAKLQAQREFRAREARMRMIVRRALENPAHRPKGCPDPSLKSEPN